VTQIADRLESAGLVERLAGNKDRRTRNLQLTGRGAEMLSIRRQRRVRRVLEVLKELSPADRVKVVEALTTLLAACANASPAAEGETARAQPLPA
jgi:DNA-binding MarR family transcriptional regulator